MKVCIIEWPNLRRPNHGNYSIMAPIRSGYGYNHLYPGKLWTLEEARAECEARGYEILGVGDTYQCADCYKQL